MDVVVSGSSGLIGTRLRAALAAAGHRPIRLVRRAPTSGADEIFWDIDAGKIDADSLEGVDAVVHLAGAGIGDRRWNDRYRTELVESRTNSTALLASTLAGLSSPPRRFLSGSAIGFYGDRGAEMLDETSSAGTGFLPDLVARWEAAAETAIDGGIATTLLRSGIVYTPTGGALKKLLTVFRFGLGGKFGAGDQYVSWITLADEVAAIMHLLESNLAGPVNLTAPNPATNAETTAALGRVLGKPTVLTVPKFAPRLLLGRDMANALLFESQRVQPAALLNDGFSFSNPDLEPALENLLQ